MPERYPDLDAERSRITRELEELRAVRRQLETALGEFLHEARRVRDALERAGGRSFELEAEEKRLAGNRRLIEADLEKNAAAREGLERRLAEIDAERAGPRGR